MKADYVEIEGQFYSPKHERVKALNYPVNVQSVNLQHLDKVQPKTRVRQRTKPLLNKLETEFKQRLSFLYSGHIIDQGLTFRLANGVRYTPDFTVFSIDDPHFTAYEVKGPHAWDDAMVKIKMAAHCYPEITWVLAWKDKETKEWKEQTVLP